MVNKQENQFMGYFQIVKGLRNIMQGDLAESERGM